MKKMWAPWRSEFIYKRKRNGCIFCKALKSRLEQKKYIVKISEYSFAMLNIYPYNNGHLMVAPKTHKGKLENLDKEQLTDLMQLTQKCVKLLDKAIKPKGFNIGINIGKIAGAGFPGHLHIHIVPRWEGDTNFMPVLAKTKVMSESLSSLYRRLKRVKI